VSCLLPRHGSATASSQLVPEICATPMAYDESTFYVSEELGHGLDRFRLRSRPCPGSATWPARPSLDWHFIYGEPRFHAYAYALGARVRGHCLLPLHGFPALRSLSSATRLA